MAAGAPVAICNTNAPRWGRTEGVMPKEVFRYGHDGHMIVGETAGAEVNLQLRWSKPEDDHVGAVVMHLGDGHGGIGPGQFIADSDNTDQLDRLIAALRRARRAITR